MEESSPRARFESSCQRAGPQVALVIGSGMSEVADRGDLLDRISFSDLFDGMGLTVAGHRGQFSLRRWSGVPVLLCEGRFHFYEGNTWETVTRPMRELHRFGATIVVQTNAAGGIDPSLTPGAFMIVRDHLELTRPFWWRHPGPAGVSPHRPTPYSQRLSQSIADVAESLGIPMSEGIYGCMTGPSYETPSEIRALEKWGADAVGMSTAREAQCAFEMGMENAAISCITNLAAGISGDRLSHQEVIETAQRQAEVLGPLLEAVAKRIASP